MRPLRRSVKTVSWQRLRCSHRGLTGSAASRLSGNTGDADGKIGLYTWEKDRHFRYIRCNENYARGGLVSIRREAMIGKSDTDMPWRDLADFFREGDYSVMQGEGPTRFNVQEKEIMVDRVADILVTENQLLDRPQPVRRGYGLLHRHHRQATHPEPVFASRRSRRSQSRSIAGGTSA